MQYTTITYMYM